jgi:16S rRNA (uracil1498-N3)-methyltransferase
VTSAPVFVVAPEQLLTERVVLDGPEGHHASQVRRIRTGEHVDLVDGVGTRAQCVVTSVEHDRVDLRVKRRDVEADARPRVVVVQALAKRDRGERAVELLTEVGVDEVVPWAASRSVVRWEGARGTRALERWRSTAHESSKQARRARFTVVEPAASTDEVAIRLSGASLGVVLTGDAPRRLSDLPVPVDGEVVLVVGPEGDLTDQELAAFEAAGALAAGLGPTVLRTSTAGVVAAAVVLSRCRW